MPEPKFVIAVGSCALSGGVFDGCYSVIGDLNKVVPVDVYIPGCPPRPEAIIYGVVQLLESLKIGKKAQPIVVPEEIPELENEEKENGN
jgi:NADH:ubiquinone oxidoreductase subunit B-like Fe-S oxidoreductase